MNLDNLNDRQLEAVKSVGSPNLIFAGAGSGKTRVLTYKIAYLIKEIEITLLSAKYGNIILVLVV